MSKFINKLDFIVNSLSPVYLHALLVLPITKLYNFIITKARFLNGEFKCRLEHELTQITDVRK